MKKAYFSRKFYEGEPPLAALAPEVELKVLEYLLTSLQERSEYEVIAIVENRIKELHLILSKKAIGPVYPIRNFNISLN